MRHWQYQDAKIIQRLSPGLIGINTRAFGSQLWAQARRGQRKSHECVICGQVPDRSTRLFRPIANPQNRMHRICPTCIEETSVNTEIVIGVFDKLIVEHWDGYHSVVQLKDVERLCQERGVPREDMYKCLDEVEADFRDRAWNVESNIVRPGVYRFTR